MKRPIVLAAMMALLMVPTLAWTDEASWVQQGRAELSNGDYKAAEKAYRRAISEGELSPQAYTGLAAALSHQNKLPEAQGLVNQVLMDNPDFAPAYYVLGLIQEKQGQLELAKSSFKTYLDKKGGKLPNEPSMRIKLRQMGLY